MSGYTLRNRRVDFGEYESVYELIHLGEARGLIFQNTHGQWFAHPYTPIDATTVTLGPFPYRRAALATYGRDWQ